MTGLVDPGARRGLVVAQVRVIAAVPQVLAHLDQLHHAPVFVGQDVTMMDVQAGEIHKPGTQLEVAAGDDVSIRIRFRLRNAERVPPDEILVEPQELLPGWPARVEYFDDLER